MKKIEKYIIAGFNIKNEKSILYTHRKTLNGFLSALGKGIEKHDLDFISIRLIKSNDKGHLKNLTDYVQDKEDIELLDLESIE